MFEQITAGVLGGLVLAVLFTLFGAQLLGLAFGVPGRLELTELAGTLSLLFFGSWLICLVAALLMDDGRAGWRGILYTCSLLAFAQSIGAVAIVLQGASTVIPVDVPISPSTW